MTTLRRGGADRRLSIRQILCGFQAIMTADARIERVPKREPGSAVYIPICAAVNLHRVICFARLLAGGNGFVAVACPPGLPNRAVHLIEYKLDRAVGHQQVDSAGV